MNTKKGVANGYKRMGSAYKTSFMLETKYLDEFYLHCQTRMDEVDTSSKYQIARFEFEGKHILIYRSGIIIFGEHNQIETIIKSFLDIQNLEIEEFEQYQSFTETDTQPTGWDETPKGVWLTTEQTKFLVTSLEGKYQNIPIEKHEMHRFKQGDQILVVNNNGVVYTIGGFDGIHDLLRSVVEENSPYGEFQRILLFDERGRWEKLGPMCIVIVDIFLADLIDLQLAGIKDHQLSRGTDHVDNMSLIETHCTYHTLVIEPRQINKISERGDYTNYLSRKISEFVENTQMDPNENTLIIVDQELSPFVETFEGKILRIGKKERDHPALGVSSTITSALIQKWSEDWYKFLGYNPEKHNIKKIRHSERIDELAKKFLL